jgi:hypothetical protein
MILILSGMPEGTIGFEAVGQVIADDYRDVIAPTLERRLPDRPLRLLFLLDDRFESYVLGAVVQDVKLWLEHLGDWVKLAVVTDHDWITNSVLDLSRLGSGRIRTFPPTELDSAKEWLARDEY